ncbi:hypothetical protein AAES_07813 [Amazona aestiva]|uniref:Uncharacterized protein n=1 Tax=Amazona aestiva TaxID=12930 RepID=A0A0Q3X915_AMAAE|nr:hypothetical protein AAES_07813 [Amazona aestiva]
MAQVLTRETKQATAFRYLQIVLVLASGGNEKRRNEDVCRGTEDDKTRTQAKGNSAPNENKHNDPSLDNTLFLKDVLLSSAVQKKDNSALP